MDKKSPKEQQGEGMLDKAKGRAKEAAGALTNDNKKRLEGQADQAKGEAKQKVGKAREEARKKI
ncbi:MAG: CsbD family protein [Rhodothermales bacterium]|nr:CsbD family protein [Rhodothermales bacterium]